MQNKIAIIGLAGYFPKSPSIEKYWENLINKANCITYFDKNTLRNEGIPDDVLDDPDYIRAKGIIPNYMEFDPDFFSLSPSESVVLDPQIRLFLECSSTILRNIQKFDSKRAGIFGSANTSRGYMHHYLMKDKELLNTFGEYFFMLNNSCDFLCTKTGYILNLSGPCMTVQTACSSSLVSVCIGCDSLLSHQCDLVIAGGVSIDYPVASGYRYQKNMILSPNGECHPFDVKSSGTVPSDGVGVVALKRLEDAFCDGENIIAVISGYGVNNDGKNKVGFTAPSVQGQIEVIREALEMGEVKSSKVQYIETHGTGTPVGDQIEFEALKKVFSKRKTPCILGSLKSNFGHLNTASGIAGLIKSSLSIYYKTLIPNYGFEGFHPILKADQSPFVILQSKASWKEKKQVAAISSFGIGGTNAHVILESANLNERPKKNLVSIPNFNKVTCWISNQNKKNEKSSIHAIISETLGTHELDISKKPVELGIDSLMSMQISERIKRELNIHIPFNDIIKCTSISEIMSNFSCKKKFKIREQENNKCSVFLFQPIGGHLYPYKGLINLLENFCNLYGFDFSLIRDYSKINSVQSVSNKYIKYIKPQLLNDKNIFIGYSFGGMIAYETSLGLENTEVILIDTPLFREKPTYFPTDQQILNGLLKPDYSRETFLVYKKNLELLVSYVPSRKRSITYISAKKFKKNSLLQVPPITYWIEYLNQDLKLRSVAENHDTIMQSRKTLSIIEEKIKCKDNNLSQSMKK